MTLGDLEVGDKFEFLNQSLRGFGSVPRDLLGVEHTLTKKNEDFGCAMSFAGGMAAGRPVRKAEDAVSPTPPQRKGDPRFHALLGKIADLHDKKQADYGTAGDPFANIRASADFGIPPWVGAVLRANDKTTRIKSFITNGNLVNESIEDSLLDNAVYHMIAYILYQETKGDVGSE